MFKEILLPVDLQETKLSERAVACAQDLANRYDSNITVLTVIPDYGLPLVASYFPEGALQKAQDDVDKELKKYIAERFDPPTSIKSTVGQGSPHKVIVSYVEKHAIDLVIMPSRANDLSKLFLGSSTSHVVDQAKCSVLVVRP
jgi:nucleotide-binding universal stress UspA family protein